MMRLIWTTGTVFFFLALPIHGQTGDKVPDPAALARAGRASIKRLQDEAASWTAIHRDPTGIQFVVEVVAAPNMRRWVLSVDLQGRRQELARITQKEGHWYVKEGAQSREVSLVSKRPSTCRQLTCI